MMILLKDRGRTGRLKPPIRPLYFAPCRQVREHFVFPHCRGIRNGCFASLRMLTECLPAIREQALDARCHPVRAWLIALRKKRQQRHLIFCLCCLWKIVM